MRSGVFREGVADPDIVSRDRDTMVVKTSAVDAVFRLIPTGNGASEGTGGVRRAVWRENGNAYVCSYIEEAGTRTIVEGYRLLGRDNGYTTFARVSVESIERYLSTKHAEEDWIDGARQAMASSPS